MKKNKKMINIQNRIKKMMSIGLLVAILVLTSGCSKAYYSEDVSDLVNIERIENVNTVDTNVPIENGQDSGAQDWTNGIPIQ